MGRPQDCNKAMELLLRAGELGYAAAYLKIAGAYHIGEGVERDEKKERYYLELAALGGNVDARYFLGVIEDGYDNMDRATKHWMIAARAGDDKSLKKIRECFIKGHASKDDFERALRAHKDSNDETKSAQRESFDAYYPQLCQQMKQHKY